MVIVLLDQAAVTPAGRPVGEPIPVAPDVLRVIGVSAVFVHRVGEEDAADEPFKVTVMIPWA
jgi:hypothetical protein